VANESEARAAIFPPRLPHALRQTLREPFVDEAAEMYDEAVGQISEPCENVDFIDRKDFMYTHGRVARFLFPIRSQYRKEFALLWRRPFLSNTVFEVVRRLPPHYRLDRNLYISMLRRHFSHTMSVPISSTRSNHDWALDVSRKETLRSYFLTLLDLNRLEQSPLGGLLNRQCFEHMRNGFFQANVRPLPHRMSWLPQWGNRVKLLTSRSPVTARLVHALETRAKNWSAPTKGSFTILRRVALLSLL
jgi:hypothetical protein